MRYLGLFSLIAGAALALPSAARGQTFTDYIDPTFSGDWNSPTRWTAGVPTSSVTAQFRPQFQTHTTFVSSVNLFAPGSAANVFFAPHYLGLTLPYVSYSLNGTQPLTVGSASAPGVMRSRGFGTFAAEGPTLAGFSVTNRLNFDAGSNTALVLAGPTTAVTNVGTVAIRGNGEFVLQSASGPAPEPRLTAQAIQPFGGGGRFVYNAPSGTLTTQNTSAILEIGRGDATALVFQQFTPTARAQLQFASLNRVDTKGFINFEAFGNVGLLNLGGTAPADPRILFSTAPGLTNGVIANTAGSAALGYAIYQRRSFAGYDTTNGVVEVATTDVSGPLTTSPTANVRLIGPASIGGTTVSFNSMVIDSNSNTLTLTGAGNLNTTGILFRPANANYTISGTSTGQISGGATRYLYVADNRSVLTLNVGFTSGQPVTVGGLGTVELAGNTDRMNIGGNLNLAGGVLRATVGGSSPTLGTNNQLNFRGGTLEVNGGGGPSSFTRNLGTGTGLVNWTTGGTNDNGGGGFSAVNGNLTVTLGNAAGLEWGGTSGGSAFFLRDGQALLFGSFYQDSTVDFTNSFSLGSSSTAGYTMREIRATRVPTAPAAAFTRLSGVISGAANNDLLISGPNLSLGGIIGGIVELTGNNTFAGNIWVYDRLVSSSGRTTLRISSDANLGAVPVSVNPNNITLNDGILSITSTMTINSNRGILLGRGNNAGIEVSSGQTVTYGGQFTGSGNLQYNRFGGSGTFNLTGSGNNATVNVFGGTFLVNGTWAGSAIAQGTGVLGGTGTIGNVTIFSGGTLAPGNSPGILNITGNLTLNAGATTAIELGGTTPGNTPSNYDQIVVTGTASINGTLALSLFGGFTPTAGDIFYILVNGTGSGTFTGLAEGATVTAGGFDFTITYLANWTGTQAGSSLTGGNDVALFYNPVAIPEPATLSSVVALLGVGAWLRWRRRTRFIDLDARSRSDLI